MNPTGPATSTVARRVRSVHAEHGGRIVAEPVPVEARGQQQQGAPGDVVLDAGKVVEQGTHDELVASGAATRGCGPRGPGAAWTRPRAEGAAPPSGGQAECVPSSALTVRPLDADTWPAFARLVEANNGVWGGCWCMGFHVRVGRGRTPAQNRAEKEQRVREGRTHAALVLDGDACLGWCQFGSPAELPEVKSRRRYEAGLTTLPDWRITCFFTGKGLRRRGVADAALGGALVEIARHGGGTVEGYPEETDDRSLAGSFLHTGPMAAFENHGFTRTRPISPHRWVVTRTVDPT